MTNDIEIKRNLIRGFYGRQWKQKVDKMSEQQVLAVYFKFKKEGKLS